MEVRDNDVSMRVDSHIVWSGEVIFVAASRPEPVQKLAVALEYQDARRLVVHDDQVARMVDCDALRTWQARFDEVKRLTVTTSFQKSGGADQDPSSQLSSNSNIIPLQDLGQANVNVIN